MQKVQQKLIVCRYKQHQLRKIFAAKVYKASESLYYFPKGKTSAALEYSKFQVKMLPLKWKSFLLKSAAASSISNATTSVLHLL